MKTLITVALVACFSAGCAQVQSMLDTAPKPTAKIVNVRLQDLSLSDVTLGFDVDVTNPYSVDLPLVNLDYALGSQGKSLLAGSLKNPGSIPARGTKRIAVPARLVFTDLLNTLQGVRPGKVIPYEARLDLSATAPVVGHVAIPLKHDGQLPVPAVPQVSVAEVKWQKLTLTDASAMVALDIGNTNEFALKLMSMSYALSLGGTTVADTRIDKALSLAASGGKGRLEIPISFKPVNMGMAVFNMLRGSDSTYRIVGNMNADTPFGAINLPYDSNGSTKLSN